MITRLKSEIAEEELDAKTKSEELSMVRNACDESEFEDRMSTYEEEDEYNKTHEKHGIFI